MSDQPTLADVEIVIERMQQLLEECGSDPDRYDEFMVRLHGARWMERALIAGPPKSALTYIYRLRDLEDRVTQIEHQLNLPPIMDDHDHPY